MHDPLSSRRLGDRTLYPIGVGCLPMSTGNDRDDERSIRAIHAALDAGVQLLDTADAYARDEAEVGHNERLIARALRSSRRRDGALVATKGGHTRRGEEWDLDGRPEHLKAACEASLRRLEIDCVDLYQFHRPDPKVPFEESVGAMRDLQDAGKVRLVGLSNVTAQQIEAARQIVDVASVQNELSPRFSHPLENGELEACERHGIAFLPWSPFGGIGRVAELDERGAPLREVAERHGVSSCRVILAWLLGRSPVVIPIPGVSRPASVVDSAQAPTLRLERDDVEAIDALFASRPSSA